MKTIRLLLPVLLMIVFMQSSLAKEKIGLYLTFKDFLSHKLSYESDGGDGNKINLHDVFGSDKIVVIQNGQKQVLSKNKVWGYRLDGKDYRFFNDEAYRIIDTDGFYIYGHNTPVPAGKGIKESESFYFSLTPESTIKALSIDNLESAFPKDTKFRYKIEGFFKTDNELTAYDNHLKEYKLKYLYHQTVK